MISADYWTQSQLPLTCLAFLLTPMVIYELGTRYLTRQQIIAFRLLEDFFNFFGATGPHLPALAVVGILLAMHIARNDRWLVNPAIVGRMAVESLLLALPIIGISIVAARYLPRLPLVGTSHAAMATGPSKVSMIVLSCGAGIYEELVFRLIAFTLLNLLIVDIFRVRKRLSALLIVAIPAILFSVYHYLGYEHFTLHSFVFRTVAGIYFGVVFLYRGFGITAGSHAAYDILIVLLTP
ncbi:MAG TPA: CPBP family intramembrane glutamic endopeptidase [Tepidisphaeraceae bacterium]|nr:CPBP family intramembrane glutamic endopeptidase [Tepidisphaeraceae bacterium]